MILREDLPHIGKYLSTEVSAVCLEQMLTWFVGGGGGEHRSNTQVDLSVGDVVGGYMQSIL